MPKHIVPLPAVPDGVDLATASHKIDPTRARYIQDAFLDEPGVIRRRGFILNWVDMVVDKRGHGFFATYSPDNTFRAGILLGNSSAQFRWLTADMDFDSGFSTAFPHSLADSDPYQIVDAKPMLGGGMVIGTSDKYGMNATKRTLALWRGAGKSDYSTGTMSTAANSPTITGNGTSWVLNAEPGMFLLKGSGGSYELIGVVKTVVSTTSITLEAPAARTYALGNYLLTSLRSFQPTYRRGKITTSTSSAVVNGGDTQFLTAGMGTSWDLFRASDGVYIGSVLESGVSNTQLTLSANAAVSMSEEDYFARPQLRAYANLDEAAHTLSRVGFLTAAWNGHQFYANRNSTMARKELTGRLWYAHRDDPEAIDFSPTDGTHFDVPSSKSGATAVMALMPTNNALLVLKEDEGHALIGTSPDDWFLKKMEGTDGTLSTMSVVPYKGGALWAGRQGIYYYDGIEATNVVEKRLGAFYKDLVQQFNPETHRMWAFIENDHYLLFIEEVSSTVDIDKGGAVSTPGQMTIAINLSSGAVTFLTNLGFRGAVKPPAELQHGTMFIANTSGNDVKVSRTVELFGSDSDDDAYASVGDTIGPDFYMESATYDLGDPQRLKKIDRLQIHNWILGANVKVDVVTGLDEDSSTSTTDLVTGAEWKNTRVKVGKVSQFIRFRFYQASAAVTRVKITDWAIVFKWLREGRTS